MYMVGFEEVIQWFHDAFYLASFMHKWESMSLSRLLSRLSKSYFILLTNILIHALEHSSCLNLHPGCQRKILDSKCGPSRGLISEVFCINCVDLGKVIHVSQKNCGPAYKIGFKDKAHAIRVVDRIITGNQSSRK